MMNVKVQARSLGTEKEMNFGRKVALSYRHRAQPMQGFRCILDSLSKTVSQEHLLISRLYHESYFTGSTVIVYPFFILKILSLSLVRNSLYLRPSGLSSTSNSYTEQS